MIYPLKDARPALVVIDAQEEYFDSEGPASFPEAAQRLPAINQLIEQFASRSLPVVYIRHANRADGSDAGRMDDFSDPDEPDSFVEGTARVEFHSGLKLLQHPIVVGKTRYDAFASTDLDRVLRTLEVDTVVLVGFMTSFCCDSTARSAHSLDYKTVFVVDAVGGPDLERADGSDYPSGEVLDDVASMLANGFAEVVDSADVVSRLDES